MKELKYYLIKNLSSSFFNIFLPLFFIGTVILLIDIAAHTAVIHFSLSDMVRMYLISLPEMLFYILPITFFIAASLSLYKFSNENELIVIFSLGISPNFIIKTFLRPALLLSTILAFNFLIVIPHTNVLYKNFVIYKKKEAKFNISASEFGHKFGNWLLYIGKKDKNSKHFEDIFLFNKNRDEEVLIYANNAKIVNKNGLLSLKLYDGEGYTYSDKKFTQTKFKTMFINDQMYADLNKIESPLEYWQSNYHKEKKKKKMIRGIMFSLFPVSSLLFVLSFSIVHSRHEKTYIYLLLFLSIIYYYGLVISIQKKMGYYTIPIVLIPWLVASFYHYKRKILKRF